MKVAEDMRVDGDQLVVRQTHDFTPVVEQARGLRDAGKQYFGESAFVGRIPTKLFFEWLKEAGVDPTDHQAAEDVLSRKLMSGDFAQFRVWDGKF
jgi:hypothetical protein